MEENWDDTIPEWVMGGESLSQGQVLQALMPLARLLTKENDLTFRGFKGERTVEGDFVFERVTVQGFEDVHLKLCYFRENLASIAVCHNYREAPQIILDAPLFMSESMDSVAED